MSLSSAYGPSLTTFWLPLTTLPAPSSGRPGSLRRPAALRSLNHATHFSKCFCISSGEPDVFRPRNKYVNSLISLLPSLKAAPNDHLRIFEQCYVRLFAHRISSLDTGSV